MTGQSGCSSARPITHASVAVSPQLIPRSLISSGEGLAQLPHDRKAVLYCKTGARSAEVLAAVKKAGFADAVHLQGGIVAWAKQVQPDMVMY